MYCVLSQKCHGCVFLVGHFIFMLECSHWLYFIVSRESGSPL